MSKRTSALESERRVVFWAASSQIHLFSIRISRHPRNRGLRRGFRCNRAPLGSKKSRITTRKGSWKRRETGACERKPRVVCTFFARRVYFPFFFSGGHFRVAGATFFFFFNDRWTLFGRKDLFTDSPVIKWKFSGSTVSMTQCFVMVIIMVIMMMRLFHDLNNTCAIIVIIVLVPFHCAGQS